MKKKAHIAVIVVGAALFCAATFALAAGMSGEPSWFHEPVVFPIRVAIWVSGNAHDPNAVAGNLAWALECLLAGYSPTPPFHSSFAVIASGRFPLHEESAQPAVRANAGTGPSISHGASPLAPAFLFEEDAAHL